MYACMHACMHTSTHTHREGKQKHRIQQDTGDLGVVGRDASVELSQEGPELRASPATCAASHNVHIVSPVAYTIAYSPCAPPPTDPVGQSYPSV